MMLSGTAQYAIRAVLHVAAHGTQSPVPVATIARALRVPRNYLSKTLHVLAREGVLQSGRGPRGGFRLAVPPAELTLARVASAFDDVTTRHCVLGHPSCSEQAACAVHARWGAIATAMHAFFVHTTVADLLAPGQVPESVPPARRTVRPRRPAARRRVPRPTRGGS